jgi:hypothetical protein
MTRQEHLRWAKDRALALLAKPSDAWASMCSDCLKHPELQDHPAIGLGTLLAVSGKLSTADQMREYIEGFN